MLSTVIFLPRRYSHPSRRAASRTREHGTGPGAPDRSIVRFHTDSALYHDMTDYVVNCMEHVLGRSDIN